MNPTHKVHLIGIGGIAMANVAILLRNAGYEIQGSDSEIYEPAASILNRAGIVAKAPYSISNLPPEDDVTVIVGNVQSRGQVEVEEALRRNLELESFPAFLRRTLMPRKCRIVVAGTHGKSTTTACIAHILTALGREPSYLVGADPLNLPFGGNHGTGDEFVIEGDEYDSAFFDKRSKFLDYFPRILVLGRVEHDHLDIFPTVEEMLLSFRRLVAQLPANGKLVVAEDSPMSMSLAAEAPCEVVTVSGESQSQWRLQDNCLISPDGERYLDFAPGVIGMHNYLNTAMSVAAVAQLGINPVNAVNAARSFRGIRRRLELIYESPRILVYDDFAHHPTAIASAIDAVRLKYPAHWIVAIFEPRSNTAVRDKYQHEFTAALSKSNEVLIGSIHRKERIPSSEILDTSRMISELKSNGVVAAAAENSEIVEYLLGRRLPLPAVLLFMSNGSFSGAPQHLVRNLRERKITVE